MTLSTLLWLLLALAPVSLLALKFLNENGAAAVIGVSGLLFIVGSWASAMTHPLISPALLVFGMTWLGLAVTVFVIQWDDNRW